MPATAGRVRMPHNNRVAAGKALQTSAIWSQTIGHNPYAERTSTEEDHLAAEVKRKREAQAKGLLQLAKEQRIANASASGADAAPPHGGGASNSSGVGRFADNNLTTQVGGNDYAQKMYYGLKQPKKRKLLPNDPTAQSGIEGGRGALDSSSSEDEYIIDDSKNEEDEQNFKSTDKKEEEEESRKDRKKKKERKKGKRKHRHRKKDDSSSDNVSDSDDDSSSSSSEEERRRRKKHKKKRRRRRDDETDRHSSSSRKRKHKSRKHKRHRDDSSSSSSSNSR